MSGLIGISCLWNHPPPSEPPETFSEGAGGTPLGPEKNGEEPAGLAVPKKRFYSLLNLIGRDDLFEELSESRWENRPEKFRIIFHFSQKKKLFQEIEKYFFFNGRVNRTNRNQITLCDLKKKLNECTMEIQLNLNTITRTKGSSWKNTPSIKKTHFLEVNCCFGLTPRLTEKQPLQLQCRAYIFPGQHAALVTKQTAALVGSVRPDPSVGSSRSKRESPRDVRPTWSDRAPFGRATNWHLCQLRGSKSNLPTMLFLAQHHCILPQTEHNS